MSIKSAPYYWLECDGVNDDGTRCGIKSTEGGEFSAWSDTDGAEAMAGGSDWDIRGARMDEHYCPDHQEGDDT